MRFASARGNHVGKTLVADAWRVPAGVFFLLFLTAHKRKELEERASQSLVSHPTLLFSLGAQMDGECFLRNS